MVLTAGTFDGLHLGHQMVIKEAMTRSRLRHGTAGLLTFDPHPREVLTPHAAPNLLTNTDKKLELMESLGVDVVFVLTFNRSLAAMSAQDFVKTILVDKLAVKELILGYDYRFGKEKEGDRLLLLQMGEEYGFTVDQLEPLCMDGVPISSTLIRELVLSGQLDEAARYLGRRYSVTGQVIKGDGRGRKLGFPTANIQPFHKALPPRGIYAVYVKDGRESRAGALNLGVRPTFYDSAEELMEVHLLDFEGDLYGKKLEVFFVKKLRDEVKFSSIDALKEQTSRDVELTREYLLRGEFQ